MGDHHHVAVVVTGFDPDIQKAWEYGRPLFELSPIMKAGANGYSSFFAAPCGGKLGGGIEYEHIISLGLFTRWLTNNGHLEWAIVKYGHDVGRPVAWAEQEPRGSLLGSLMMGLNKARPLIEAASDLDAVLPRDLAKAGYGVIYEERRVLLAALHDILHLLPTLTTEKEPE